MPSQPLLAYHIFDKEEQKGPFTRRQLGSMWDQGLLTASAQYFDEPTQEWKPVAGLIAEQNTAALVLAPVPVVSAEPIAPAPPLAPMQFIAPTQVIVQPPAEVVIRQSYKSLFTASWIILLLICCASLVPFIGWVVWFIASPFLLVTFILSIIIISRGGTGKGIAILACTLVLVPVFMILGQLLSSFVATSAAFVGVLSLPAVAEAHQVSDGLQKAKQLGLALKLCASDNNGVYPARLDDLVPTYVGNRSLFACPLNPKEPVGYDYSHGLTDASAPDSVLLRSKAKTSDGRRIIVYLDNRTEAKVDAAPTVPASPPERVGTARAENPAAPTPDATAAPAYTLPPSFVARLDSPVPAEPPSGGVRTMPAEAVTPEPTPRRLPEKTWDHPHVYIQICDETQRPAAELIKKELQNNHDVVMNIDNVHDHPSVPADASEVRYIVSGDIGESEEIASTVRQFMSGQKVVTAPPVPETAYVSHSRQYEIWLSRSFRPLPMVSRLDPAVVNRWNVAQVQTAIVEIYARHGANFTRRKDQEWAEKQSWYHAVPGLTHDAAEQSFTAEERADIELLAARRASITK